MAAGSMAGGAYLTFTRILFTVLARAVTVALGILLLALDLACTGPIQDIWCWTYGEALAFVVTVPFLIISIIVGSPLPPYAAGRGNS